MTIKVLGTGCAKCKKLEAHVRKAVDEMEVDATIEKVENIEDIMSYGVMSTPALIVNGETKVTGKVPNVREIKKYLS